MKQCTTSNHLNRTIHQLEHILADETFPAIQAAEVLKAMLLELAPQLPELEQQMKEIVTLYEECAARQYGPLYRSNGTKKGY